MPQDIVTRQPWFRFIFFKYRHNKTMINVEWDCLPRVDSLFVVQKDLLAPSRWQLPSSKNKNLRKAAEERATNESPERDAYPQPCGSDWKWAAAEPEQSSYGCGNIAIVHIHIYKRHMCVYMRIVFLGAQVLWSSGRQREYVLRTRQICWLCES